MKKLLGILAMTVISNCAFAQADSMKMHDTSMAKMGHMKKDCFMMENGKMMMMMHGKTMMMDSTMKLKNGMTVMKNGEIKMPDGTTKMLKEGQCMYMDGKVEKMNMKMN